MSEFNLIFATPFLRAATNSQPLARSLTAYILERETEDYRHPNSPQAAHDGVFESTFDFLDWKGEPVQELKRLLLRYLGGFVKLVNDMDDQALEALQFANHCWFHVTRDGGFFQPHNHANASWSLIYCVDPGDETPANPHCAGHVAFRDPRFGASMYMDPANRRMRRDMSFNAVRVRPAQGELFIFPSYLVHWVEPYAGERPRITVAANFWFSRPDA